MKTPQLAGFINEADKDGNTALHLAAIHQNIEIIGTFASDSRVDMTATNKEFSKAVDIFVVDDGKLVYNRSRHPIAGCGGSTITPSRIHPSLSLHDHLGRASRMNQSICCISGDMPCLLGIQHLFAKFIHRMSFDEQIW